MSHLADALRRANRHATAPEAFRDDDHPWGDALDAMIAEAPAEAWTLDDESRDDDPGCGTAAANPPPRSGPVPVSEPAFVRGASAVAHPGARQQIAALIERVFLPAGGPAPRVVAFASVEADDSSGRVVAATATMLAQRTGARVGAIDLNFAAPSVHDWLAVPKTPGLFEALGSDGPLLDAAKQVRANLWVVPAGESDAGAELSAGSRTRIAHLTDAFDYVVMTLEPLADGFGAGLATLADGVVLVVNAETTRRDTGRTAAERLQACGAALLGAVLTNRRYPIPDAIYRRL